MKINRLYFSRQNESGMVTMIFIALLVIMMILVMTELRALNHLHRETRFVEQQQIKRLNGASTNVISAIVTQESK